MGISQSGGFTWATGSNTNKYLLVTRPRMQQALQAQRYAASDTGDRYVPLNIDPALHFPAPEGSQGNAPMGITSPNDVIVDTYVGYGTNTGVTLQTTNAALAAMTVVAPDGTVYGPGASGSGITFLRVITETNTIPYEPGKSNVRVAHLAPDTVPVTVWDYTPSGTIHPVCRQPTSSPTSWLWT